MNADDEFASVILVKHNMVDVLARELDRPHGRASRSRSARRPTRISRSKVITS